jgi:exodeoxyribonuclease I
MYDLVTTEPTAEKLIELGYNRHPPHFTIYDFETTGCAARYDQPLQFGAVRLDDDLREIDAIELVARPQLHILPSPNALLIQGRGIGAIVEAPLSHYQLMAKIEHVATLWGPSIWSGYNSIKFDEEVLRHSLYCALRHPYLTQYNHNTRCDVMRLVQLAAIIEPDAINLPVRFGKRIFKLEAVASANDFHDHDAHCALSDARATAHLLRVIRARAPATWRLHANLIWKTAVVEMLLDAEFTVVIEYFFGTAIAKPVLPICANPDYLTEWLAIDLTRDPLPLLGMSPEALGAALAGPRSALCRIKTNAMPLVISGAHPAASRLVPANVLPDVADRARSVREQPGFADRLLQAWEIARSVYTASDHVEDQLYQQGFFPTRDDEDLFDAFHAAAPDEKHSIAQAMTDERARRLAQRIMYNEWPQALPADEYSQIDHECAACWYRSGVPWMTVPKALPEIEKLRVSATPDQGAILDEYELYLRDLGEADGQGITSGGCQPMARRRKL